MLVLMRQSRYRARSTRTWTDTRHDQRGHVAALTLAAVYPGLCLRPTSLDGATRRTPQAVLASDDDWPLDWANSGLRIKRAFRNLGHKHWGFTVYRWTYGDDLAWEQLMTRLHRCIRENLRSPGIEELTEFLDIPVHEDAELDGASKDLVRRRFNKWLATDAYEERLNADARPTIIEGAGTTPRYQYCLQVDEEALRSVVPVHYDTSISDETVDTRGFLNLIDANWALLSGEEAEELRRELEVEDPCDEGEEALDGCRMHDVGWMRVGIGSVMPGFCSQLLKGSWEHNYVRPPGIG
ncbi:hypothetical protein LTS02_017130 [Friedmanniomyces endolithicus]|nr:hypothetical protein LTS02_017130 [Friedmanniomyces endolithicus]